MRALQTSVAFLLLLVSSTAASATGEPPRSARLVKDAGDQFLSAKKYADAIDCYFQALEIHPEFAVAHYNLGIAFFKGYQEAGLAHYHFDQYLRLAPDAADYDNVLALSRSLAARAKPLPKEPGRMVAVIGGRLLVSGVGDARPGDRVRIADAAYRGLSARIEYIYPDGTGLTERVWHEDPSDRPPYFRDDDRLEERLRPDATPTKAAAG